MNKFLNRIIAITLLLLFMNTNCYASEISTSDLFRTDASIESEEKIPKINEEKETEIENNIKEEIEVITNEENEKIETNKDIEKNDEQLVLQNENTNTKTNKNNNFTLMAFCVCSVVLTIFFGMIVTIKNLNKHKN